jgi:anti-anti-sigma factor
MKHTVRRLLGADRRPLVIDLSGTEYIDSSGVGVLLFIHAQCLRARRKYCFAGLQQPVTRVLKLTGLDGVFPLEDGVEDAVVFLKKAAG